MTESYKLHFENWIDYFWKAFLTESRTKEVRVVVKGKQNRKALTVDYDQIIFYGDIRLISVISKLRLRFV